MCGRTSPLGCIGKDGDARSLPRLAFMLLRECSYVNSCPCSLLESVAVSPFGAVAVVRCPVGKHFGRASSLHSGRRFPRGSFDCEGDALQRVG